MIDRKTDIINYLGSALFIIFFFLLISSFTDKSVKQTKNTIQFELVFELHSNSGNAIIAEAFQLPSFQKNCLSFIDKTNFRLFNENLKVTSYNRNIAQRILLLQINQVSIKPLIIRRFYYHLSLPDTEEFSILS